MENEVPIKATLQQRQRMSQAQEFEAALTRVITSQEPFLNSIVSAMGALEARVENLNQAVTENSRAVDKLNAVRVQSELDAMELRLKALEDEHQQRQGAVKMMAWIPKAITVLAVAVAAVIGYWKFQGPGAR